MLSTSVWRRKSQSGVLVDFLNKFNCLGYYSIFEIFTGHKGHEEITLRHRNVPPLDGNEEEYSLNAQVLHKMNFINTYVPDGTKIHLIGHSIGAWMVLEMLKSPFLRKRVVQCYLLFPTIERLAVSPKGWLFNNIILPFSPILKVLVQCFNKLSVSKRSRLIQWYFWLKGIPYYYVDTVLKFLTPPVIEKVLFLAKNEMKIVRELNHEVIKECFPLLQLYYGANDEWVPTKYFEDLKQKYPKINAVMDTEKIDHSFVLNNSIEMADIVGQFIKTYSNLFYY